MDAQTWQLISIVGYSLAGLLFIIAIIMFIKMNIWSVIGDLTGRTAAKQIQEIREQNARTGNKHYRPSAFNLERGKLTEPVGSRKLGRKGNRGTTRSLWKLGGRGQTQEVTRPEITRNLPTDALSKSMNLNLSSVQQQHPGPVLVETTVSRDDRVLVGDETTTELVSKVASEVDSTTVLGNEVNSEMDATTVLGSEVASTVEETTVLGSGNDRFIEATTVLDDRQAILIEETGIMSHGTQVLEQGTDVLSNDRENLENGTDVLKDGTDVLNDGFDRGTEVLSTDVGTTVLNPTEDLSNEEHVSQAIDFKIVKDIKIIHTDKGI